MTTAIVIQARTGSSRLPGKVLLPLAGQPLLLRMVERVSAARVQATIVVATTTDPADDALCRVCDVARVPVFRGHPTDLLDRHYQAARALGADIVVKIPSDCPLIDPAVIERVLDAFAHARGTLDFMSNLHPATYPDGNDVEVMTMEALTTAWREASRPFEREHTTPYLWERPERFRIGNVVRGDGRNLSMTHRWTIDYPEDYLFLRAVYHELWRPERPIFPMHDILQLVNARADIAALNSAYAGVNWYRHHLEELHTIRPDETRQAPVPDTHRTLSA